MSLRDAAVASGLSASHLRLLARTGRLNARKYGHDWLTTREWLTAYLADEELRKRGRPPKAMPPEK
jgi:hypothetical protein